MRKHDRHARLSPRIDAEAFHEIVSAENAICARLDPAFGLRVDSEGLLDLAFAKHGRVVLVPFLLIQAAMLLMRETSPYIWPSWLPPLRESVARDIEGLIDPWIKSLIVGRFADDERFALFGEDAPARALAERARAFGFLGAAPTDAVLRAIAPYVFAQRFSRGKRVTVEDAEGAAGASILARGAQSVRADLGDAERNETARRWFDLDAFGPATGEGPSDVWIGSRGRGNGEPVRIVVGGPAGAGERLVTVSTPIPPAVMISFDPGDGGPMQQLAVSAPARGARPDGVPGIEMASGSAGRIALVVRSDFASNDGPDVDAARALAYRLAEQGFTPSVVPANHLRPGHYDLLHVFGLRVAADLEALLAPMTAHPPVVLTPYADDPAREDAWGSAMVSSTLVNAFDARQRAMYFDAIRERRLESQGQPVRGASTLDARAALQRAAAVIASTEEEARRLGEEFGVRQCRIVPGVLAPSPAPQELAGLCGLDDFVFVHAPMESRGNQLAIAAAAAELGYPLVLAGAVQDTGYYAECCAALGDLGIWIGADQLDAGELAALYGRCRVYADASWSSGGLYRLLRAGAAGAALVAPTSGYARGVWPGLVQLVDPASRPSVREGLREAWKRAGELGPAIAARTIEAAHPFASLVGVVTAYQQAAAAVPAQT